MRFMLIMGSGSLANKVRIYYKFSVKVRGGTKGIIGSSVSAICPATMITTANGTLLLATGYGPMLRMRQNEKSLTTAGVPAPRAQVIIATGVDLGEQPAATTLSFDYTRFGLIRGTFDARGHSYQDNPQGAASLQARMVDFQRILPLIQDSPSKMTTITVTGASALPIGASAGNSSNPFGNIYKGNQPGTIVIRPVTDNYPVYGIGGSYYNTNARQQVEHLFTGIVRGDFLEFIHTGSLVTQVAWLNQTFSLQITNQAYNSAPSKYNGRYQAFMRYVDKDYNVSDPSPISADIVLHDEPAIVYTNLEVPTDARIIRRQIFRNENGNSDIFYLDIDTDDLTSTVMYSLNTDAQLKLNFSQAVFDDNNVNLLYLYGMPPTDKPFIAEFCNIVYAVGNRTYSEGNVIATNGSKDFYGVGTNWPESFIGRQIVVGNAVYSIVAVDTAAQKITTDVGYSGASNPYAEYTIQSYFANGNLLNWTESGLPEAWPIANALQLPEDDDELTGLKVFANALWILKANSIYQFNTTINPGRDGDYKPATNRGCVNQRCAVDIQNVCLMMDRTGIHVFKGNMPRYNYQADSTPDHLSKAVDDLFRFEGTWIRVNWRADKCFWHAVHNKELKTVRWFITMEGYDYPQHAICYDYLMDKWWLEKYPVPIASSVISIALSGLPIYGGYAGQVMISDRGSLDFVSTGQTTLSVTACYAGITLVLSKIPTPCEGITIAIVDGTGHGQERIVLAQVGNEVTLDAPFFPEPDESSVVQIGAISYYMLTAEYNKARFEVNSPQTFNLQYRKSPTDLVCYATVTENRNEDRTVALRSSWGAVTSDPERYDQQYRIDLAHQDCMGSVIMDGQIEHDMPQKYSIQMAVEGFSGQSKPQITSLSVSGSSLKREVMVT